VCYCILEVEATQDYILQYRKHIRQIIVPQALSLFLDKFKLRSHAVTHGNITVVEIAKLLTCLRKETVLTREDVVNTFVNDDAYNVYVNKVQAILSNIKSYLSNSVDKYKKLIATTWYSLTHLLTHSPTHSLT
jgi:predicted nucleic-acid-binding protein